MDDAPDKKQDREELIAALIDELGCDRASAEAALALYGDVREEAAEVMSDG